MDDIVFYIIGFYLFGASLWAIGATIYDKRAACKNFCRVKERQLLFIAAIGGSVAMLVTMRIIRHKTRHTKFTVGIPLIILIQAVVVIFVWRRFCGGDF